MYNASLDVKPCSDSHVTAARRLLPQALAYYLIGSPLPAEAPKPDPCHKLGLGGVCDVVLRDVTPQPENEMPFSSHAVGVG